MKVWFQRTILRRIWLCFIVMGISFSAFGLGTINLFYLLQANANLLLNHGWMAVMDGGLRQIVELLLSGYASLVAYIIFKACEYRLTHWLSDH